ncbi:MULTISPECIES: helix-turn-helix transcriptional regulator [Hallerella]|uniref:helix-turn-helix domain-containing protein n=1 Tax=Hallerella TaxID=2815788 RepID=UPI000D6C5FE7
MFWFHRYTIQEILNLFKDKSISLVEISRRLNFSSQTYFSRYIQKHLEKIPSDFRR